MIGLADVAQNLQRLLPAQQRDAGIALALGRIGVNVVTVYAGQGLGDLIFLGLGFLQQDAIGVDSSQSFGKTFALHGANAVNVPGDDFHGLDGWSCDRLILSAEGAKVMRNRPELAAAGVIAPYRNGSAENIWPNRSGSA